MRWILVAAVVALTASVVIAPSFGSEIDGVEADLLEAIELEEEALHEFRVHSIQIESWLEDSDAILTRLLRQPLPQTARDDIRLARANDRSVAAEVASDPLPGPIVAKLEEAIAAKEEALADVRASEIAAKGSKPSEKTTVSPPACRFLAMTAISGCSGVESWELYVDRGARKARCAFAGPAGPLSVARPLFARTFQTRTCRLLSRTKTVGGVVKRVVRAELRITVPIGVTVTGSKSVRVTAYWQ